MADSMASHDEVNSEFPSRCQRSLIEHDVIANQFLSIDDARSKIEAWRRDYNYHRPHSALGQLTPNEYLKRSANEGKEAAIFQL